MFRRIELIRETPLATVTRDTARLEARYGEIEGIEALVPRRYHKFGLCFGAYDAEVIEAWIDINSPRKRFGRNSRFFFTERGWDRYGRGTVAACIRVDQQYRVVAVKEASVDVVYRDDLQVAVRPRRRRDRARSRSVGPGGD